MIFHTQIVDTRTSFTGMEDDCQILSCTQDTRGMMQTEDDDVVVGTASCS